ncbi:MAG: sugar phosphate isomerase/epimerase [Clostridia bacterium]|nr:sugar phosphate isomerase/epimerase [Clostridia bacterium]
METGMCIFNGIDFADQVKYLKKHGVSRTFVMSDTPDFDKVMELFSENGIICETLHAPFDKINDMWSTNETSAQSMLDRLKDGVDKCAKYKIPTIIVHVSSGQPMPEINAQGVARYDELFEYARSAGVTVALENLRYLENLSFFMDRHADLVFCWDCGHEYGFTKGIRFLNLYGDRLGALHIHDNRCGVNTDDHLIPFDGMIDFDKITDALAEVSYTGTMMLEIGKLVSVEHSLPYASLSDEEFIIRAASAAKKLADEVESKRQAI